VGEYSKILAEKLGMSEIFVKEIRIQALLHDIGKIHTPPEILKSLADLHLRNLRMRGNIQFMGQRYWATI